MSKKIKAMALAVLMVLSVFALAACGGEAAYQVKVVDAQGNPYTSGVIVKFMQDGKQAGMQPVNGEGVSEKTLPKGDYSVELVFTDDALTGHYDKEKAVLSAKTTTLEIVLMSGVSGEGKTLFATSPATGEGKEYTAYEVLAGSTYVTLEAGERNYFLFSPTEAGTYKFSVDNNDYTIGYYGAPHFVQAQSAAEVTDNTFTISVSKSMIGDANTGTSSYVIGVDGAKENAGCGLTIERIGDPAWSVSDEPFTEYKTTHTPAPFSLKLGAGEKLTYVDITGKTSENKVVYNEQDGYYHYGKADGPIVYVHLGKGAPYVALQVVIEGDGAAGGAPIRCYFYEEDGTFVKKEDYTSILSGYFANMDEELKIYPLNDDLAYIIQNGCYGWWDATSPDYIFEGCNPEIGWMFALCYVTAG
jgi:hypothetical protein